MEIGFWFHRKADDVLASYFEAKLLASAGSLTFWSSASTLLPSDFDALLLDLLKHFFGCF